MKLTKEHKEGAELFYSELQRRLSGIETGVLVPNTVKLALVVTIGN